MWSCWTLPGCPAWIAPVISKAHASLSSREQASRKYSVEVLVFSLMRSCGEKESDQHSKAQWARESCQQKGQAQVVQSRDCPVPWPLVYAPVVSATSLGHFRQWGAHSLLRQASPLGQIN